jgi:hypothetical protein
MGQLFWIRRPLPLSKTDIGYLFNPLLSHRSVLFLNSQARVRFGEALSCSEDTSV